jgi:hypothetical protein
MGNKGERKVLFELRIALQEADLILHTDGQDVNRLRELVSGCKDLSGILILNQLKREEVMRCE